MDFKNYEFDGEEGTCDGYIIMENEKVYVDFDYTFNLSFYDGYAEISNTIIREATINGANLVNILRNNEVWADAESIILAEIEDKMNDQQRKQAMAEDLASQAHKEARYAARLAA